MASNDRITWGLIGCGGFGQFTLDALTSLPQVQLAGVADVLEPAADAAAKRFGLRAYDSPQALLADDDIQMVHIASPPSSHYELALAAANAGKHILCEKPLALNTDQADRILRAAAGANVICPVNFVMRYVPVTEAVKAVIDSGRLGKVLSARLTNCASDSNLPREHWFWKREISGGIFIEHGVHFFDLYDYWLGKGQIVYAHAETRDHTDQQDRVTCVAVHDNGAIASHYHGFDQIGPLDRTDHRLVMETGDIRVEGWIPLKLTIDAAVDDAGVDDLVRCCGGKAQVRLTEELEGKDFVGRGKRHRLTRRIRLEYEPFADKSALYAQAVRDLVSDQIAFINGSGQRRISEHNGRQAVAMAQAATQAESKHLFLEEKVETF
ncbi:MAG: Gfo/Idh/MocA family oxidoreductase [Planctomycetaceae bacterium]|nr:Gfo/Idh/MocA family oxidoreductase [Planctomycetaceae bacterium]